MQTKLGLLVVEDWVLNAVAINFLPSFGLPVVGWRPV